MNPERMGFVAGMFVFSQEIVKILLFFINWLLL